MTKINNEKVKAPNQDLVVKFFTLRIEIMG